MDFVDQFTSARADKVSSCSSQSLESFHRTSERLLYECINSITDLIHRQIERARQNEFSSDEWKNDVARSVFSFSPEARSSMRNLSTDAWSIFKSLTSLIKQRALASRSPSSQESPGDVQRQQLDASELQQHLERLLSRVHGLEASQQSGINMTGSLNQLNDPEFNDYLHRLRNHSQPDFSDSSLGESSRKEAEPMCYNTVREVAEFAGQRDALQNMARVLTELDSLVKDIDEVPKENERNERDQSCDGSWSEKVLPPKKGRHLMGNTAINAENNGLDWTDDGRLSSTSNESRAAQYSILSGGGNWGQWKFSTGEPFSSSLARYQQNTDYQTIDTQTNFRASNGRSTPNTPPSIHIDAIEEMTPEKQLKQVVDTASRYTDEGYYTGKCRPSKESEPKAGYSDMKYDFYDGTTLIYSKPNSKSDIESLTLKSDPDRWKFTKVEVSDKDGSYSSSLRDEISDLSQDIRSGSAADMISQSNHKARSKLSNKGVNYVSSDESKFSWLESITLNPDSISSKRMSHSGLATAEPKSKWIADHSSLQSYSKDGHDMADLYAYDNGCYLDSGSSNTEFVMDKTGEVIGDLSTEHPLEAYPEERTVWKDARADSQFVVENYIGATSNQSVLKNHNIVSTGDISVAGLDDSTKGTSLKSCSRPYNSQRSEQIRSANSSRGESGISSPDSTYGNKKLKSVGNFWSDPATKDKSDHSFTGSTPGMDFYNRAVQQLTEMIHGTQVDPVSERFSNSEKSSLNLNLDEDKKHGTSQSSQHSKFDSYTISQQNSSEEDNGMSENAQSERGKMSTSIHTIPGSPSAERYSSRIDIGSPQMSQSIGEQVPSVPRFSSRGSSKSNLKDRRSKTSRHSVPFGNISRGSSNSLNRGSSGISNLFRAMEGLNDGNIGKNGTASPRSLTSFSKRSGSNSGCRSQVSEKAISDNRSRDAKEALSGMLEKALSGTSDVSKQQSKSFTESIHSQKSNSFPSTPNGTLHTIQGDVSVSSVSYPVFSGCQPENKIVEDNFERRINSGYPSCNLISLSSNSSGSEQSSKVSDGKSHISGDGQCSLSSRINNTSIIPDTSYCTSAKTIPSLASTKTSCSPSSANSFKAVDSAPWGLLPTASKSCPSIITLPSRKHIVCSCCRSIADPSSSHWKSNLATVIGYMLAFYILFTILCSAIETHKRSYEGCGFMILDDLYRNFELRHIGPVCT